MIWNDKAIWLDINATPDFDKLSRYGIKTVYIDPNSGNARDVVLSLQSRTLNPGIYWATSWLEGATPIQFVDRVHVDVRRLIPQAYPLSSQVRGAPVMLDLEAVSKTWQAAVITEYRRQLPSRETAYTNEPFKDGTVVPVNELVAANMHWYPQTYKGDMSPVDAAAVVLEVARWGFPVGRIHPFYDAAHLPDGWRDGCVFTQNRLP